MTNQPHVINIHIRVVRLRHQNRIVPKAEAIDAVVTLSDGKERFSIAAFHAHGKYVFVIKLHRTAIEGSIDADSFEEMWIGVEVKIVTPEDWSMGCCNHRMFITFD